MAPPIPACIDACAPPAMPLLRWLSQHPQATLGHVPDDNASLPDLLQLSGHHDLDSQLDDLPLPFRWEGAGGARVLLSGALDEAETAPLHQGALPAQLPETDSGALRSVFSLLDLARLEDATAVATGHGGAEWGPLLAVLDRPGPRSVPPLAGRLSSGHTNAFQAWNPLPFRRRCPVTLPLDDDAPPWALCDDDGRHFPAQVVEGPLGRQLLTQVVLGALEARTLHRYDEPQDNSHWHIDATCVDNGLTRAELDELGQIVRLSFNHRFTAIAGPLLQARYQGLPISAETTCTILESGPVRARVAIERHSDAGTLHLVYSVFAGEDYLHVHAHWTGEEPCWLRLPTAYRHGPARYAGELAPWSEFQAPSITGTNPRTRHGLRFLALGDDDRSTEGLAMVAPRPFSALCEHGRIHVAVSAPISFVLCERQGSQRATLSLGHLSQHLSLAGRAAAAGSQHPPRWRLVDAPRLVPIWLDKPSDWDGELLLVEQGGERGKAALYLPGCSSETGQCVLVDAHGERRQACRPTPEGDGFQIPFEPGQVLLLRWRS